MVEEHDKLSARYRELKECTDDAISEKDALLSAQKLQIDCLSTSVGIRINEKRKTEEITKTKAKKSAVGSIKSEEIIKCEFSGCGKNDVDLAMCSSYATHVYEDCNNVQSEKCRNIHFLCKACITDSKDNV